ncbi:hypothetical protein ACFXKG_06740 [Streptomyces sp. NPDC059255]|uniref:hypothetical protein n=1 Tax=Streptomyces sp. NPDC059255 TaxID=3346793 RepID=UPI0036C58729
MTGRPPAHVSPPVFLTAPRPTSTTVLLRAAGPAERVAPADRPFLRPAGTNSAE